MTDWQTSTDPGRPALNRAGRKAPPGPWWDEPDRAEWTHAGLTCRALRGPFGAWCGYVGLPEDHPLHGADYGDVDVRVHGGLTYAGSLRAGGTAWWLGFDCSHGGDFAPSLLQVSPELYEGNVYRPLVPYVVGQVEQLAEQLARFGDPAEPLDDATAVREVSWVAREARELSASLGVDDPERRRAFFRRKARLLRYIGEPVLAAAAEKAAERL